MRPRLLFAFVIALLGLSGLTVLAGQSGSLAVAGSTPPKAPAPATQRFIDTAEKAEDAGFVRRGPDGAITAKGWVSVTHFDQLKGAVTPPAERLVLNTKDGQTFDLSVPKAAAVTSTVGSTTPKAAVLAQGDVTTVSGTAKGDTITVTQAATSAVLPSPYLQPSQGVRASETRRALFILATFPEDRARGVSAQPIDVQSVKDAVNGVGLADKSVRNFFRVSSRDTLTLQGDVTTWQTITTPRGENCNYDEWMTTAKASVLAEGQFDPATYDYVQLVNPYIYKAAPSTEYLCDFGGVSFGPRLTQSFFFGDTFPKGTAIHELGHSIGLGHAGSEVCRKDGRSVPVGLQTDCQGVRNGTRATEYDDSSDVMGSSGYMRTFSAAQRAKLGFLPLDNVVSVSADGVERTIARTDQPLSAGKQLLEVKRPVEVSGTRVYPDGTRRPVDYALEYRGVGTPFDDFPASSRAVNRVTIRLTSPANAPAKLRTTLINPAPGKTHPGGQPYGLPFAVDYLYDTGLAAGQSHYDPVENYTITVTGITATAATVKVTPGGPPGGTAAATSVSVASGVLAAIAKPGRSNAVSVTLEDGRYLVSDFGNPVVAGAGCVAVDPVTVACNATGVRDLQITTDDRDDVVAVQDTVTVPTSMNGGAGADILEGSTNADDTFLSPSLDGADMMDGYGGLDSLNYASRTGSVKIPGSDVGTVIGEDGEGDRARSIENYSTGSGNDQIELLGSVKRRISVGGGTDTVRTGSGDDLILARDSAADTIDCGNGADRTSYDASLDAATGCEKAFENVQVTIGATPREGESITNRSPAIPLLTSGRRTGSVVQCALTVPSGTPSWATCPSTSSYTPASALADGTYTLGLRLLDTAGAVVGDPDTRTFKVDNAVPNTTFTLTPGAVSARDGVKFTAAGPTGSTFECSLDGAAWTSCLASRTLNALAGGSHTYRVRVYGPSGLVDPTPATHTWTVDVTPPDTAIGGTPAQGASVDPAPTNHTFTSTEAGSTFECAFGDDEFAPCTSPTVRNFVEPGSYTLKVVAIDPVGNRDPSPAVRTWTVVAQTFDTEMVSAPDPFARKFSPSKPPVYTFRATGTGGPFTFRCKAGDAAPVACTSPWSPPVVDNYYEMIEIAAVNAAGVEDYTPLVEDFLGDVDAPATALTSGPADGAVVPTDVTPRTFTFGLDAPGEKPAATCAVGTPSDCTTFECKLDAAPWAPCATPYTTVAVGLGSHTLNVRAVDQAGNVDLTPAVRTWNVVAAPQTAFTGGPAAGAVVTTATPTYTFAATPATGATFECTVAPTTAGGTWVPCTSPWTVPAQANNAAVVVQVRAKNAAGYTDPVPDQRLVKIDLSSLQVSPNAASAATVDLTAETGYGAALDWIRWGSSTPSTFNRMNATQRIGTWSTVGSGSTGTTNGQSTFSWSNATGGTPSGSNIFGVIRPSTGAGLTFSVPANNTEVRKLRVHFGVRGASTVATLKVTMGDKAPVTQTITGSNANRSATITYRPRTTTESVTVELTRTDSTTTSGGVLLYAAALH